MTPDLLKQYAQTMKDLGIRRVTGEEKEDGLDFCIEMDPSAFPSPIPTETAPASVPKDLGAGEKKCPCGHLQDSEHNNAGLCIAGACPYTVCHPEATAKPG